MIDFSDPNGYGIRFNHPAVGDITQAIWRAVELFNSSNKVSTIRERMMKLDFSWETSVRHYLDLYQSLL